MKIQHSIYIIEDKEVCTPSTDYYRRENDWQSENIRTLRLIETKDTHEECVEYIKRVLSDEDTYDNNVRYTILPEYVYSES